MKNDEHSSEMSALYFNHVLYPRIKDVICQCLIIGFGRPIDNLSNATRPGELHSLASCPALHDGVGSLPITCQATKRLIQC